ncbi:MAG: hypothetical protein GX962_00790 [Epulopiscium sp.]|nr:hypothetical protein [Candidatus Epulonipiscium sp.]
MSREKLQEPCIYDQKEKKENSIRQSDYHVHYYIDGCAKPTMTFEQIEKTAKEIGLETISVLKHYSQHMPNGESEWIYWNTTDQESFQKYIKEIGSYKSQHHITIYSGVETELLNSEGDINIPLEEIEKIDMITLSVHWIPKISNFGHHPDVWPNDPSHTSEKAMIKWKQAISDIGTEKIIEGMVTGYINAIKKYSKIKVLAHMEDGLLPLRRYFITFEHLGEEKLIQLLEPLMKACAENGVLWEITQSPIVYESILKRANDLGVLFTPTADAHSLDIFREYILADQFIKSLGLNKGNI